MFEWIDTLLFVINNRMLSGDEEHHTEDGHSSFGVHIVFLDLYYSVLFFTLIYVSGKIASTLFKMPSLVGEIICGVICGPGLLDFVPNPEAFVMLGEIGLILLVLEAGVDIDLTTLKMIGGRGVLIATFGSILPIGFGIAIAFALGEDTIASLAAGACFGPTSLGIAMNVLRSAKIVNTPIGQMIVAAAIVDDMIALIVLSQLNALVDTITVAGVLIPIISALAFLVIGGYVAIALFPPVFEKIVLQRCSLHMKGQISLGAMFLLLLLLLPATNYAQASYLMGAFIAGLAFCSNHDAHAQFASQFKRVMQWLMRIFFAASIGFQVPVKDFANGIVIWQGLVFTLALLGKILVGFMVPNFSQNRRFTGLHLRDCLITSFSMTAEGEFAFVIAVFAVDNELISKDLYASIVLAILLSTIIAPFALRITISYYNKKAEQLLKNAEEIEYHRSMELTASQYSDSTLFVCIQIYCDSQWGLLYAIINALSELKLDIIDHRTWSPRGANTTLMNEVYVEDSLTIEMAHNINVDQVLEDRLREIRDKLIKAIKQPDAGVRVHRWFPGVLEEMFEETTQKEDGTIVVKHLKGVDIKKTIAMEANQKLEESKDKQMNVTKQRDVSEIIAERNDTEVSEELKTDESTIGTTTGSLTRRMKTFSTPVIGGDLFADKLNTMTRYPGPNLQTIREPRDIEVPPTPSKNPRSHLVKSRSVGSSSKMFVDDIAVTISSNKKPKETFGELNVNGKIYRIELSQQAFNRILRDATISQIDNSNPVPIGIDDVKYLPQRMESIDEMLEGFVRRREPEVSQQPAKRSGRLSSPSIRSYNRKHSM